jgi:hypothetical protein
MPRRARRGTRMWNLPRGSRARVSTTGSLLFPRGCALVGPRRPCRNEPFARGRNGVQHLPSNSHFWRASRHARKWRHRGLVRLRKGGKGSEVRSPKQELHGDLPFPLGESTHALVVGRGGRADGVQRLPCIATFGALRRLVHELPSRSERRWDVACEPNAPRERKSRLGGWQRKMRRVPRSRRRSLAIDRRPCSPRQPERCTRRGLPNVPCRSERRGPSSRRRRPRCRPVRTGHEGRTPRHLERCHQDLRGHLLPRRIRRLGTWTSLDRRSSRERVRSLPRSSTAPAACRKQRVFGGGLPRRNDHAKRRAYARRKGRPRGRAPPKHRAVNPGVPPPLASHQAVRSTCASRIPRWGPTIGDSLPLSQTELRHRISWSRVLTNEADLKT